MKKGKKKHKKLVVRVELPPGFHPSRVSACYPTNLIFPSMALCSGERSSINYPLSASGRCGAVAAAGRFKAKISGLLNQLQPLRSCLNVRIDLGV